MGEPRRVALVSTLLPQEKKAAGLGKISNGEETKKDVTIELVYFDVEEPSEDFGPTYSFSALLGAKKAEQGNNKPELADPFDETKDEEKAAKLAKHFEEKYGGPRDVRDLGAGYDQNDPFVDDSELAEAMIPDGWTTQHGGHYVGTGPLYIRQLQPGEEETHAYQSLTADECLAACKSLGALTLKRKTREESSEEADSEEDETPKQTPKIRKKKKQLGSLKIDSKKVIPDVNSKKNYRTVASILAERTPDVSEQASTSSAVAAEKPDDLSIKKRDREPAAPRSKDFEGGVRKAVLAKFERDFAAEPDEPILPLPDDVPGPLQELIMDLKKMAATWEGGKCNFFAPEHNPDINRMLLEATSMDRELNNGLVQERVNQMQQFKL